MGLGQEDLGVRQKLAFFGRLFAQSAKVGSGILSRFTF